MNNEVKVDAKFVKAQHHNSNPNHDAQWETDGIKQLEVSDIPQITLSMKNALDKFNYKAVCDFMAREYELNILNPDALKAFMYENAMNVIATMTKILIEGTSCPPREFWFDETWLQADIAFTLPIHCRIRHYPEDQFKVILEFIPFASEMSIERR
jgi:hypothetical protein